MRDKGPKSIFFHKRNIYSLELGHLLIKTLGKGGMGEVFLAFDPICKRSVAIKKIPDELLDSPTSTSGFKKGQDHGPANAPSHHPHFRIRILQEAIIKPCRRKSSRSYYKNANKKQIAESLFLRRSHFRPL